MAEAGAATGDSPRLGWKCFRKRPVVIEAIHLDGSEEAIRCALMRIGESNATPTPEGGIFIETLEGRMEARSGDWIIYGVKGEFYPCKPAIFEFTYEPAARPR